MKIQLLVIGQVTEKLELIQSLNKALQQKYGLVFYPWPSKGDLKSEVKNCRVVIISDFSAAAAAAAAASADPEENKPIIFITSKEGYQENLNKYTRFVTIGHNWKLCVLDGEFLDTVESAINISHHKQKLRTTIHSIRTQLVQETEQKKTPYYRKLLQAEEDIKKKNLELEKLTAQLKKRVNELEKWEKITVGRELRIAELKKKIKELEKR